MRAGAVVTRQQVLQVGLDHYAGTGTRLEFEKLIAKPVALPDDGVNEVLDGLAFDRHFLLKTGEGVIPRR